MKKTRKQCLAATKSVCMKHGERTTHVKNLQTYVFGNSKETETVKRLQVEGKKRNACKGRRKTNIRIDEGRATTMRRSRWQHATDRFRTEVCTV